MIGRRRHGLWLACVAVVLAASAAAPAYADMQLAADKGCYNCHGDPPKKKAPTFAQLAADYAKYGSDEAALHQLADKLRSGSIFSHADAHERLNDADALRLVRWIASGVPR